MSEHPSAWKPLIDEWVARERRLHPDAPIQEDTVRVRDSVEIDDLAYVLVSYEVDQPWPAEENAPGDSRSANTAVLQAVRVRQPWVERDATRALGELHTPDGEVRVFEHVLGARRAFSGCVSDTFGAAHPVITLRYDDDNAVEARVVDGWFLAVVPEAWRLERLAAAAGNGGEPYDAELVRDDLSELFTTRLSLARAAGQALYFSPLDLRSVLPLAQWERAGQVVVVASSLEQYDEGGVVRLRIDGVRSDDDLFVTWPTISVRAGDTPLVSAICGEYGLADTLTVDLGFKPWLGDGTSELVVRVSDLRGVDGPVAPIEMRIAAVEPRS